jgi:hypothetical protein
MLVYWEPINFDIFVFISKYYFYFIEKLKLKCLGLTTLYKIERLDFSLREHEGEVKA